MNNRRVVQFFQFTENNLDPNQSGIFVRDPFISNYRIILSVLLLAVIAVGFALIDQHQLHNSKKSQVATTTKSSTLHLTKDSSLVKQIVYTSQIPPLHLSAKKQYLHVALIHKRELFAFEQENEAFNESSLVVMDKVIVIPKALGIKSKLID